MSLDLQTIGVAFDTSGLEKGAAALGRTAQAGGAAADAADKVSGALGRQSKAAGEAATGTARYGQGLGDAYQRAMAFIAGLGRQTAATDSANDALRKHTDELNKARAAQEKAARSAGVLSGAVKLLAGVWASIRLADFARDSVMLAARFETLGVVMRVAGNNAGYTKAQMDGFSGTLQKTGISMMQSRNAIVQLATANIDLAQAQGIARAAQDLAVVGQTNSSEALGRMIHGIKSGQVEILRTLGLNVSFEQSYQKLADTLGKNVDALSENEKMQARTNVVMEASKRYAGIYEESMSTVGKAIGSLTRYIEDLRVKLGGNLLPSLGVAVGLLTQALKEANKELDKGGGSVKTFAQGLDTVLAGALKTTAVLAHVAYTAYKMLTIQIGAGLAAVTAAASGNLDKARAIGVEATAQTQAAEAANRAFIEEMVRGQAKVQSGQEKGKVLSEAELIAAGKASRAQADQDEKEAEQKRNLTAFTKEYASETEKAAMAVAEWKNKLGPLFTPEMEKKVLEGLGGKGAQAALRKANTLIEQALAARVELAKQAAEAETRTAQASVAEITYLRKTGALEEIEAIEQIGAAELKALQATARAAQVKADLEKQRPKNRNANGQLDTSAEIAAAAELQRARDAAAARQIATEREVAELNFKLMQDRRQAFTAQVDAYLALAQVQRQQREELEDANTLAARELALMGQTEAQRNAALAALRAEIALKKQLRAIEGNGKLDPLSQKTLANQARANALIAQGTDELQTQARLLKELDASLDPAKAQGFGDALRDAFTGAGDSVAKLINSLDTYATKQAEIAADQAKIDQLKPGPERAERELKLAQRLAKVQVSSYGDMANAAKGFFKESSGGYKALEAAEKAFRLYELSSRALAFATKMGWITQEVGVSLVADQTMAASAVAGAGTEVAATMTVANANAVAGVANQAKGDPYSAFARMATMAAIMAAMGLAVRGGGGGGSSVSVREERQARQGTGTVLGDEGAKSSSITRSLELLSGNSNIALRFTSEMLASLRSIDNGIAAMSGTVARTGGIRGTPLDAINAGVGSRKGTLGFSKSSTSLLDQGLFVPAQAVGAIVAGGIEAYKYTTTETQSSSWWGLRNKTRRSTTSSPLDADIEALFTTTIASLSKGVQLAAKAFGPQLISYWAEGTARVEAQLQRFVVDIGTVSLAGLNAEEIQAELSAVFSRVGDQMAKAVIPGLEDFQQVGEGYFQTVIRVAQATEEAQYQLEQFGITAVGFTRVTEKQGDVAAEIVRESIMALERSWSGIGQIIATMGGTAEEIATTYGSLRGLRDSMQSVGLSTSALTRNLIRGGRSIDGLQSGLDAYIENFFSEAERLGAATYLLGSQFSQLGLRMPTTRDGFRALVEGINTTTDAGQLLLGQVLALAGAFAEVTTEAGVMYDTITESLMDENRRLTIERTRADPAFGGEERARDMQRETDTAGYTDGQKFTYAMNQYLRDQITLANQQFELDKRTAEASGGLAAVRALELTRIAAVLRPMQQLIWQREDEAKRLAERQALEKRLLQAQGNTAELRRQELAALDASLRPLQQQIWATEDASALNTQRVAVERRLLELQSTTTQLRQADLAAMDAGLRVLQARVWALEDEAKALEERSGLERRLLELQGNTAAIRALERSTIMAANFALYDRITALQDEQARLAALAEQRQTAIEALEQAYDKEANALTQQIDDLTASAESLRDFSKSLREFRDGLTLGALSPLTPGEKYTEAAGQFEATYAAAAGGDQDAMGRLQQAASEFLTTSQRYLASSPAYQADFARVQTALTLTAAATDAQATAAEQQRALAQAQLTQLEAAVGALIDLEQAVLSVVDAIAALALYPAPAAAQGQAAGLPAYAEGTDYVPRTGPAVLHQGEAVLPRGVVALAASAPALAPRLEAIAQEVRLLAEQSAAQTRALIQANYDANARAASQIVEGSGRSRFVQSQALSAKEIA